jgi:hypothetical protein
VWKRSNRFVSSITCHCQEPGDILNILYVSSLDVHKKVMGCRTVVNPLLNAEVYRTVVNLLLNAEVYRTVVNTKTNPNKAVNT